MLPEYYDRFKTEYIETVRGLKAEFNRICGEGADTGNIAGFQQNVINACESMEENWLPEDCGIVRHFEEICELLFAYSCGEGNAPDRIRDLLDQMLGSFDEYVEKKECKLTVALIERNERRYLKEWVEYHRLMGAEHFLVYDHGSTDNPVDVLDPYIRSGIMSFVSVDGEHHPAQMMAYNDAVRQSRYSTRYLAFIDADEFLVPMKHKTVVKAVEDIITAYEDTPFKFTGAGEVGGIGVNWRVYGTSGHKEPVQGLVTDEFRYRGPDELMINCHIKTICKPIAVKNIINPHFAIYQPGYWCISEHGSLIPGPFFYDSKCDILRVNHYYTKSEEEYRTRRMNYVRNSAGRQRMATEEEIMRTNEIRDDVMERFLDDLKNRCL